MNIQPIYTKLATACCIGLFQLIATHVSAQCTTLICEENVQVWTNSDCDATINPYYLIVNQNQCSGPKIFEFFDNGVSLGDTIADAQDYIGQTLDVWVKHKWSNKTCWGTVTIMDKKPPVIACENMRIKCTEDFDVPNLGEPEAHDNCTAVESLTYTDEVIDFGCGQQGFEGFFDPTNWMVTTSNGDGGVDVTGAPNSVIMQGADASPINTTPRYVTVFKIVIPGEGYISFDWNSFGGSDFQTDAFYVTINGVCIQLSYNDVTSGSYTTQLLQAGDMLSFEQTSDGSADHVNTEISNFQFITTTYKIINRTWTAIDAYENEGTCTQVIELERATLADIHFPANHDGEDAPMMDCGEGYDPSITGYPFLDDDENLATTNDQYIIENGDCTFNLTYEDQIIPTCPGSELILRTWTVLDWCSSTVLQEIQLIKRFDMTAPVISTCPAPFVVSTSSVDCSATVVLPDLIAQDACMGDIEAVPSWQFGTGNQLYEYIPLGTHTLTYTATDACGNTSNCTTDVTVVDGYSPTMVCDEFTTVSISSDGTGWVHAVNLDDGSYDQCCVDENSFEIKKASDTDDNYAPALFIDCNDVGQSIMVLVRLSDCAGNKNACQVEITVSDNDAPVILPPNSVSTDCSSMDMSDLSVFGSPQVYDNCNFTLTESITENINNCGQGNIIRVWTATDDSGNSMTASQTILLENQTPWNTNNDQIIWPQDYTLDGCQYDLEPTTLPTPFGVPTFVGEGSCELAAVNMEDEILWLSEPACFLLFRTWTVVDWCQSDATNGAQGTWTHTQTIEVIDTEAPVFVDAPTEIIVAINSLANCHAPVFLPTPNVSDCSDHLTLSAVGDLGSGMSFSNVATGIYNMTFQASDGCGNTASHAFVVQVIDNKAPTPICENGLIVEISQNGTAAVDMELLNYSSFDNCTDTDELIYSFSANPADQILHLNCTQIGQLPITLWVTDAAGNQDFCSTFIELQDNLNACGSAPGSANISGQVFTAEDFPVQNVELLVNNPAIQPVMTDENGQYIFENMPLGNSYEIRPEKNTNPTNGVTTFDILKINHHILGTDMITSPYSLIAADANNNGIISTTDIVAIQRVILFMDDNFANNTSWRFVPANYAFQNPQNPFAEAFPESLTVQNMGGAITLEDFIAIKIGDINGNVNPQLYTGNNGTTNQVNEMMLENRSSERLLLSASDQHFLAGEVISVSVSAKELSDLVSWQMTIDYDENKLSFQDIIGNELGEVAPIFGKSRLQQGAITAIWTNNFLTELPQDVELFQLIFTAKQAGQLSDVVHISSRFTPALAYNSQGEQREIDLIFEKTSSNTALFELKQNMPNPVFESTLIEFTLPEEGAVSFTFFDTKGNVLHTRKAIYPSGNHQIMVSAKDLSNSSGIVFYRMQCHEFTETQKMLLLKK